MSDPVLIPIRVSLARTVASSDIKAVFLLPSKAFNAAQINSLGFRSEE
jgi:hypothetical protein